MLMPSDILGWKQSMQCVSCALFTELNDPYSDIEHIWQTTWRLGFYRGGPVFMSALAGIDIALWDLKGMKLYSMSSNTVITSNS
jgi:L-alanine-DL-glutamate epimerase-like enolase superfamily enzyme